MYLVSFYDRYERGPSCKFLKMCKQGSMFVSDNVCVY